MAINHLHRLPEGPARTRLIRTTILPQEKKKMLTKKISTPKTIYLPELGTTRTNHEEIDPTRIQNRPENAQPEVTREKQKKQGKENSPEPTFRRTSTSLKLPTGIIVGDARGSLARKVLNFPPHQNRPHRLREGWTRINNKRPFPRAAEACALSVRLLFGSRSARSLRECALRASLSHTFADENTAPDNAACWRKKVHRGGERESCERADHVTRCKMSRCHKRETSVARHKQSASHGVCCARGESECHLAANCVFIYEGEGKRGRIKT